MKLIIKLFIVLFFFNTLNCNAQNRKLHNFFSSYMEFAENVFDGEIIEVECFGEEIQNNRGQYEYAEIYTGHYIKIHKVYKGNFNEGQVVCLVTIGGYIQRNDGREFISKSEDYITYPLHTKALFTTKGSKIRDIRRSKVTLFSITRNLVVYDDLITFNKDIYWKSYESFFKFLDKIVSLKVGDYENADGFYPEPEDNAKIKKALKKKVDAQFADTSGKCVNKNKCLPYDEFKEKQRILKEKSNSGSRRSVVGLTYTFENQYVSGNADGDKFYEFDVCVKASQSGSYLYYSTALISFNNGLLGIGGAFDSYLYEDAETEITLSDPFSEMYNLQRVAYGDGQDNFGFQVSDNLSASDFERIEVSSTEAVPLVHCKLKIKNCDKDPELVLWDYPESIAYFTSAADRAVLFPINYTEYSPLNVSDELHVETCEIVIDNITPATVTAGTHDGNDIITISGHGFGQTRNAPFGGGTQKGEVYFRSADNPAEYVKANDVDCISWTDEQIEMRVSSVVRVSTDGFATSKDITIGTGNVKVQHYMNYEAESSDELNIQYTIANDIYPTSGQPQSKHRVHLTNDSYEDTGDILFVLDENIVSQSSDIIPCIKQALADWSCILDINLSLEIDPTTNLPVTSTYFTNYPNERTELRNVIGFFPISSDVSNGLKLMTTKLFFTCCNPSDPHYVSKQNIGIQKEYWYNDGVSTTIRQVDWCYNTTGSVPYQEYDFYGAMLHELGHVLLVNHIIDEDDLMYWTQNYGPLSESSRKTLGANSTNSIAAARKVIEFSQNTTYSCNGPRTLNTSTQNLCGAIAIPNIPELNVPVGGEFEISYYVIEDFNDGNTFTVELSDANGDFIDPVIIGSVESTTSSVIPVILPSDVVMGDGYRVRLVASDPQTTGPESNVTITVSCNFIDIPQNVTASPISDSGIEITWDIVAGASGYDIYLSDGTLLASTVANLYSHSGLTSNTTYEYQVVAKCGTIQSDNSETASAITNISSPDGLTLAALSQSEIEVSWDAVNGAQSYSIINCTSGEIINSTNTSHTITNLQGGNLYSFQVQAICATSSSNPTECQSVYTFPVTPVNINAYGISDSEIEVNWSTVVGADSYNISDCNGVLLGSSATTTFTNRGLSVLTTYGYQVAAHTPSGFSDYSACTYGRTLISFPYNLSALSISSSEVRLTWNDVEGAEHYIIKDCNSNQTWQTNSNIFIVDDLTTYTSYSFQVKAVNGSEESIYSPCVSVQTQIEIPQIHYSYNESTDELIVFWPPVTGGDTYYLYSCEGILQTSTNQTAYFSSLSGLEGANYRIKVRDQYGNYSLISECVPFFKEVDICSPSLYINETVLDENKKYKSSGSIIIENSSVSNFVAVSMEAEEKIRIRPGFRANSNRGSYFRAKIEACDNSVLSNETLAKSLINSTTYRKDNSDDDLELDMFSDIKIYPNPTQGKITVQIGDLANDISISLFDTHGKQIYEQDNVAESTEVDLSKQEKGDYFVTITIGNMKKTWKLIKL